MTALSRMLKLDKICMLLRRSVFEVGEHLVQELDDGAVKLDGGQRIGPRVPARDHNQIGRRGPLQCALHQPERRPYREGRPKRLSLKFK